MEFKDYYKILNVDADATDVAIKVAYRKLARKFHPDVSDHKDAEERFKEATEAYEVLKNKEKRAEYDELRQYGASADGFQVPPGWQNANPFGRGEQHHYEGDFSDFFNSIFGNSHAHSNSKTQRNRQRGQDIETDLPVFLEDTLGKESKTIEYNIPRLRPDGQTEYQKKTLKVQIPGGVTDGARVRLKNQGGQGLDNCPNGDLYLRIRLVPHPLFDVEGHNLVISLPILPWECVLGIKVEVPTLTGKIQLTVPPNSANGLRMRVAGHGLLGPNGRGDLFVQLNVVMPASTDDKAKQHWQALADMSDGLPQPRWSTN